MSPATVLARTVVDELIRCGLAEAVLAPGSRSAPLAMELHRRAAAGDLRLHVRIDERSAAFTALGLAKASRTPVAVLCTSGTAAAHFHAAVIEADESAVPLLVLTADRPPELHGTGANQTIDQLRLYGTAARWFCELGGAGSAAQAVELAGYWRSAAAQAWGIASGLAGGTAGPVHVNLPLREPLVPDPGDDCLTGRPGGAPWTRFAESLDLVRIERGLIVLGDGDYDAWPLLDLAERAGWPVLAEPSSNGRRGSCALSAYQYLLASADFMATHRPEVLVSAGRPGLSRGQTALLKTGASRHVVLRQGPGRWSDPARTATDVAGRVRLADAAPAEAGLTEAGLTEAGPGPAGPGPAGPGPAGPGPAEPGPAFPVAAGPVAAGPGRGDPGGWLADWLRADAACRTAADQVLDADPGLSEPRLARDIAAMLPDGALLWVASSLPVRDLDQHMAPRSGLRILASRGASGIDGMASSAIGAALAHQTAGGGPAVALLGDLAALHDAPGLFIGPDEPRPDLCLIVVNNDGGGIFSMLEQAAFPEPFERVFGTPHGARLADLAAAAGLGYELVETPAQLAWLLSGLSRSPRAAGIRLAEVRTSRSGQAELRASMRQAANAVLTR